ncbi:nitrite reductase small subunit NirD [Melghirimyces algeriensis]|uniref:Nitrite reductase (NADH) small subunit n=1 Tax=Melghirimyces algeriensis TaxID=910412 RepID=A0A521BV98_9BACL|nr:nitrite reductase small subunit NirD [Melghirimyces algeriensis]SMO51122.1 nitrite reductase (NADH) small subunit [Melghirimyces algeriensis]
MKRISIGHIEEFPLKAGRRVHAGECEIAVFRLSDGSFRAVENVCPHLGGPLAEGMVSGDFVYCPLHEWKIHLQDGKVQDPDSGCVKTYPVVMERNRVWVILEKADLMSVK